VILRASKQHATNLAKFVAIYKSLLLLQRQLNGGKGQRPHDSFFAGLLGGYVVFGERNAINEQVRTHHCYYSKILPHNPQSFASFAFFLCGYVDVDTLMAAVSFVVVVVVVVVWFPYFIDF